MSEDSASPPKPSRFRFALICLAWVLVALLVGDLFIWWRGATRPIFVTLVVLTPLALLVAVIAAVVFALLKTRTVAVTLLALAAVLSATQAPLFGRHPDAAPPSHQLIVMSSNLEYGKGSAADVVRYVKQRDVDVLALQELTDDAVVRLRDAGLEKVLPYSVTESSGGATGTGVYSRFKLTETPRITGYTFHQVRVLIRGAQSAPFTFGSVHPVAPIPDNTANWARELRRLPVTLEGADELVVAGDFNSTNDHAQFRGFLSNAQVTDAARQANAGLVRTFPSTAKIPPIAGLDHVVMRGGPRATSVSTATIDNTDHRALIVTLAMPDVVPR